MIYYRDNNFVIIAQCDHCGKISAIGITMDQQRLQSAELMKYAKVILQEDDWIVSPHNTYCSMKCLDDNIMELEGRKLYRKKEY